MNTESLIYAAIGFLLSFTIEKLYQLMTKQQTDATKLLIIDEIKALEERLESKFINLIKNQQAILKECHFCKKFNKSFDDFTN